MKTLIKFLQYLKGSVYLTSLWVITIAYAWYQMLFIGYIDSYITIIVVLVLFFITWLEDIIIVVTNGKLTIANNRWLKLGIVRPKKESYIILSLWVSPRLIPFCKIPYYRITEIMVGSKMGIKRNW